MPSIVLPAVAALALLSGSVSAAVAGRHQHEASGPTKQQVELLRYLPVTVGDMWLYRDRVADEEWLLTLTEASPSGGVQLLRWDDSSGDYRVLSLSPEAGLLLHELHFFDGRELHFQEPVPILPPRLSLGETHRARGRFVDITATEAREATEESSGELEIEVTLAALAPIQTPSGTYSDCPLLRWRARLEGVFGAHEVEVETALAEGVGVIRLLGRISRPGAAGEGPREDAIHRVLEEAILGSSGAAFEGTSPPP